LKSETSTFTTPLLFKKKLNTVKLLVVGQLGIVTYMWDVILITGTITGIVYALIAISFALIYGVSGISDLTVGAHFMIGAYLYATFLKVLPNYIPPLFPYSTPILALIISSITTGIIGAIFYRVALHQILGDDVNILITSICACVIIQQLVTVIGGTATASAYNVEPIVYGLIPIGNVNIESQRLLSALISIAIFIALAVILMKTKRGKAMRALSEDLEAAMLMGINVDRTFILVSMISGCLAGLSGTLYLSISGWVSSLAWLGGLSLAFSIVILGGLKSLKGAFVGGLIFAYAELIMLKMGIGAEILLKSFPFIIAIIVLIIRPKGLFGKRIEME
jgi:branched-chain amino acid transport system permease protein